MYQLTDNDKQVCRALGITEEAYAAERDKEMTEVAAAAAIEAALSPTELKACAAVGVSPAAYLEQKQREAQGAR